MLGHMELSLQFLNLIFQMMKLLYNCLVITNTHVVDEN